MELIFIDFGFAQMPIETEPRVSPKADCAGASPLPPHLSRNEYTRTQRNTSGVNL